MIEAMHFRQSKPSTVKILGVVILLFIGYIVYAGAPPLSQISTMSAIGILLVGYSISYEIKADFNKNKHFKLFGITVFKHSLALIFPEYITVFSVRFKHGSDWGPVAAMGKGNSNANFVFRLLKGHRHFTILKTNSLKLANTEVDKLGNF